MSRAVSQHVSRARRSTKRQKRVHARLRRAMGGVVRRRPGTPVTSFSRIATGVPDQRCTAALRLRCTASGTRAERATRYVESAPLGYDFTPSHPQPTRVPQRNHVLQIVLKIRRLPCKWPLPDPPPEPSQFDRGRRVTHVPGESNGRINSEFRRRNSPNPLVINESCRC
jgi:hypothetical protein